MAAKAEDNLLSRLTDTLHLRTELTATASHGDFAPYWMSNNRYGVASVGNNWGTGEAELPLRGAAGLLQRTV